MDEAEKHFIDTIGALPAGVALLRRHAPAGFEEYARTRARLYRPPPEGALPVVQKELVFLVADVIAGHAEGAKAHAAAGVAAGLGRAQVMEALEIVMLVHGHHCWAAAGAAVMAHLDQPETERTSDGSK